MKISTLRAAAKRHGLTVTKVDVSDEPDTSDDSVTLSNGVEIQISLCGTPVGVTVITEIPEWTQYHDYWEVTPSADDIVLKAIALKKRMDLDIAKELNHV